MRTEFGTVVVQDDICNGCGYCIPACPFGVIDRREGDGRAWKCTLCYDRLGDGLEPACAKACPTESIQFGPVDELRERAQQRVGELHEAGVTGARLYLEDPDDGIGGGGAFFLLLDEPEVYGLPPDPVVTTRDLPRMWRHVATAAGALLVGGLAAALRRDRAHEPGRRARGGPGPGGQRERRPGRRGAGPGGPHAGAVRRARPRPARTGPAGRAGDGPLRGPARRGRAPRWGRP